MRRGEVVGVEYKIRLLMVFYDPTLLDPANVYNCLLVYVCYSLQGCD